MIAFVLVAALNCGASATQLDLDECAAAAQTRNAQLESAAFTAAGQRFRNNALLHISEVSWLAFRTSACNYVYEAYTGGSIAPMLYSQCMADAAQARVRDIAMFTGRANPAAAKPDPKIQAEHERIYGLLELLVSPQERHLLANSEYAFLRYREAACSHAQDGCATAVTKTRTQQLKDSWLAEKFW